MYLEQLVIQLNRLPKGYYRLLQVITGCYRLLQVVTGCYRLLQVVTGYYRLRQVKIGYYMLLESDKRLTRVLHKVSVGLREPYLRLT